MRKNKGFTLIELMIVIAIIAIIAAIAIPNLMQSRLRANEATAVTCVRNYGTAQVTFQLGQQASVTTNTKEANSGLRGFADNFRNLFYGQPRTTPDAGGKYKADSTRTLGLISQAHADASFLAVGGQPTSSKCLAPTVADGATGIIYQGYYFVEDQDLLTNGTRRFESNYAILAVPGSSSTTGNNAFWMDSENSVMKQGLKEDQDHTDVNTAVQGKTPLSGAANRKNWQAL